MSTKLAKAAARLEAWRSEPRHTMGQMVLTDPNQVRADLRTVLDALKEAQAQVDALTKTKVAEFHALDTAKPVIKWRGNKASVVMPVEIQLEADYDEGDAITGSFWGYRLRLPAAPGSTFKGIVKHGIAGNEAIAKAAAEKALEGLVAR